jgi:RND family efflux transporter MFP subunit
MSASTSLPTTHGPATTPKPNPTSTPKRGSRTAIVATILLILVIALAVVITRGIRVRTTAAASVAENTAELSIPAVSVFHPKLGEAASEIILSGSIQAYTEAPIYARASGYIKKWYVTMGDHVKEGQILAEIEAPEVDQQVNQAQAVVQQTRAAVTQAEANLQQSQANEALAKISAERWKDLSDQGIFSKQDNDLKQSQYEAQHANSVALERAVNAARANVAAGEANLKMLDQVQSYRTVRAPFDGVITARNTDIGALVVAGNTTVTPALFRMAATDKLRLYVNVPEASSRAAVPGLIADLTLAEFPDRRFQAKLVRTSGALDPVTNTLLTEFEIDNHSGQLKPGSYAEVHMMLGVPGHRLLVPVSSVLFRPDGPQVGVVEGGKAKLVPVTLGKDFGTSIELLSGVSENDSVIDTPPDSLASGMSVRVVTPNAGE